MRTKICGIKEPHALHAACENGADFIGFVFYPPSPRYVDRDTAYDLSRLIPTSIRSVGLFVDPEISFLEDITSRVPLDMIQLHGSETPHDVIAVKEKFHMPIIKAFRIGNMEDLNEVYAYEDCVDWLLLDSKPVQATLPGGTGHKFDWTLLKGVSFKTNWMLSGGLTNQNITKAIKTLGSENRPDALDVSSGVEKSRGEKCSEKIKEFLEISKML